MPDTDQPITRQTRKAASGSTADGVRSWNELTAEASGCRLCRLHEGRTAVVFGDGDRQARLMLIGTAPGRHEDLQGRPFAGALGNVLDTCLSAAGLSRDDVYVTTVVKCRPPDDREPQQDEVATCLPYLRRQIGHVAPEVVVTMGELATRLLLRRSSPIALVAGYRFEIDGAVVLPTYDPLVALRGSSFAMRALRRDLRMARAVLEGRAPGRAIPIADLAGDGALGGPA